MGSSSALLPGNINTSSRPPISDVLSPGQIAGIVVAIVAVAIVLVAAAWIVFRKRREMRLQGTPGSGGGLDVRKGEGD